jgi:GNAT superfamily N-acetyltransferase
MIERLHLPPDETDVRQLAELLSAAVAAGAAVSFLAPFPPHRAEAWWHGVFAAASPRAIFLVARDAGRIVGTVQLQPAWAPNQPHRGEIVKLLVDERHRGSGVGAALMKAVERAACDDGYRLLTLDAKRGTAAERLYHRLGWTAVGSIPAYALDPDGVTPHDAVFFYKVIP